MAEKEIRAIGGAVAFEDNKMLFIANALTQKEQSQESTSQTVENSVKNRWAYMAIGYKECQGLRKNNPDAKDLLEALKKKYEGIVIDAVEAYDGISKDSIKNIRVSSKGKEVYLRHSKMVKTNSIEELILYEGMYTQAKHLKDIHKQKAAKTTRMCLSLTRQEVQKLMSEDYPFAIIALAYGYKGEDEYLELVDLPEVHVAFVPRTRLECGVFFDGTFNNMYNTQMREAYEKYFELKVKKISGELKPLPDEWEALILEPKITQDTLMPLILKDLQKQMKTIYGSERKQEDEYDDGIIFGWFKEDVSKDCDAIYEYFKDSGMQKLLNKIKDIQELSNDILSKPLKTKEIESIKKEAYEGKEAYLDKNKRIDNYIETKILIGDSYTGAHSNIAKLYELYLGNSKHDKASAHQHSHLYESLKHRIYVTGAGTHSDNAEGNHEEDDLFLGQALAIGDAGIKAKVNDACKQLHMIVTKMEHKYVDTLVLDVFGFSRGAAEARHFVGALSKDLQCTFERSLDNGYTEYELTKAGDNLYSHILKEDEEKKDEIVIDKIVFRFVGVFDTVPHYGLFQGSEKGSLELKLEPTKVSRVVHLTAKDEYRYNFDLVSINSSKDAELPKHFEEKEFFGAHSDVGGGYRDNKEEMIELPTQYKNNVSKAYDKEVKDKIKQWNHTTHWVSENPYIDFFTNKAEIGAKGDGFYIKKYIYTRSQGRIKRKVSRYHIYMYRKSIDTEYSQIPFEYMYEEAKKLAPFKKIGKLSYKDMDVLDKDKVLSLDLEYGKDIKAQFFHHSISLNVANKPNRSHEEKKFYEARDVHYV